MKSMFGRNTGRHLCHKQLGCGSACHRWGLCGAGLWARSLGWHPGAPGMGAGAPEREPCGGESQPREREKSRTAADLLAMGS